MRCMLTRRCTRSLWYVVILAGMLLLVSHGLLKMSRARLGVTSVDFNNVITFYDDYAAPANEDKKRSSATDELTEDYDVDGNSLRDIYAEIDKTLNQQPSVNKFRLHKLHEYKPAAASANESKAGKAVVPDWSRSNLNDDDVSSTDNQSVNIIINSYGVRKSTVLDELFVNNPDALIFYQPSLTLRPYWYLRGDNQVCSMKNTNCMLSGEDTSRMVLKCLIGLLQCSAETLATCIAPSGIVTHPDVAKYNDCKTNARSESDASTCLRMLQAMCTSAKVKVVSVRNTALDVLDHMLNYVQNVKVIHVFRDLRPVIFSDKARDSAFLSSSGDNFYNRAHSLCNRSTYDLDIALDLQKRETLDRFQMVTQENIINGSGSDRVELSSVFNMRMTSGKTVYDVIATGVHDVISKHQTLDRTWRLNMDISTVTVGFNVCQNVYKQLGYRLV